MVSGLLVSGDRRGGERQCKKDQGHPDQETPPSNLPAAWLHPGMQAGCTGPTPVFLSGIEQRIAPVLPAQ